MADGVEVTHRQMEALAAVAERGSLRSAAGALGISTPVLHKYIRDAEGKVGASLVTSTSRGSALTGDGRGLLRTFEESELRLRDREGFRAAGTLVSERCLLTAATALSSEGVVCRVSISTDPENLRMVDQGRLDCVILDDALHVMERAETFEGIEVGTDILLHKRKGEEYLRLAFGAQRLAFRHLEQKGAAHTIVSTVFEPAVLDRTELSYFVNRSLVRRGIVKASGAREQSWSAHSVLAVPCSEHADMGGFVCEARRAGLYPKG